MLTSVSYFLNLLCVDQQKWPLLCLYDEILTELPIPVLPESVHYLCATPAWQCSRVIIDKTTVSGNTCQGLSIVFEMDRIPPIVNCKLLSVTGDTDLH